MKDKNGRKNLAAFTTELSQNPLVAEIYTVTDESLERLEKFLELCRVAEQLSSLNLCAPKTDEEKRRVEENAAAINRIASRLNAAAHHAISSLDIWDDSDAETEPEDEDLPSSHMPPRAATAGSSEDDEY